MSISINGTNGVTFNDGSLQKTSAQTGFRNRIINGDMRIDQRNAGASVTPTNGQYTLDRWFALISQTSKFTVQQNAGSVTLPAGFTNYLGCTSSSAYTVGASENFIMYQYIEGFNTADLGWGTVNASTVTLSFWARSSLTGTFGGSLLNDASNRSYPFTYTINAASTFEYKTVTIAGDTSGTWIGATNGVGIKVGFSLGAGSTVSGTAGAWAGANYRSATGATSVVGTNGATLYITGVQLEAGSTATEFERRPIGTELALCQRYFQKYTNVYQNVAQWTSNELMYGYPLPVQMRSAPTATLSNVSSGTAGSHSVTATHIRYLTINSHTTAGGYTFDFDLAIEL
jgi:hypothetical protein